jgi:hypothetical protein
MTAQPRRAELVSAGGAAALYSEASDERHKEIAHQSSSAAGTLINDKKL